MQRIETFVLLPGSADIATCARWRSETFSVLETSIDAEIAALRAFVSDQEKQIALIARAGGEPIGTCLLVPSEIDPNHAVSPWLAGLFVAPEHRRKGAGAILVRAIEAQARLRGFGRLYLYTDDAVDYYRRLGWDVVDRTNWKGFDTALMVREL